MQLMYSHTNEGASAPLVIPMNVICNTAEDQVLANVLCNSKRVKRWVKTEPAHDGVAVICGSGPSLADNLVRIVLLAKNGAKIFALNGAASYLDGHEIVPDYQILMDAQEHTAQLIGPARAHLFASQVHPSCFEKVPDATLWHSTYGDLLVDEQEGFPAHYDDYCLIGSAASVGNTSLGLIYALGYRTLHIFGMDSSHRGVHGHVTHQAINDGDPCVSVTLDGKDYVCSFTMKLQAEGFQQRAAELEEAGCKIHVYGDGYLQALWNAPKEHLTEQQKYERLWGTSIYREYAPAEHAAKQFNKLFPVKGTVIDFGCGTGRGAMELRNHGHQVVAVDFANNCLDWNIREHIELHQADLTQPMLLRGDYGFCVDVMEHITPDQVDNVIRNIMECVPVCFFQISLVDDDLGSVIKQKLHLSVHSRYWWSECFKRLRLHIQRNEAKGNAAVFVISST